MVEHVTAHDGNRRTVDLTIHLADGELVLTLSHEDGDYDTTVYAPMQDLGAVFKHLIRMEESLMQLHLDRAWHPRGK